MNNIFKILLIIFFLNTSITFSQFDYGLNFGISLKSDKILDISGNSESPEGSLDGYYFGVYSQINLLLFYLRPEINILRHSQKYQSLDFKETKLELPFSIGYKLLPTFSLFTGPTFNYLINDKVDSYSLKNLESKTTIGFHIGSRIRLGPIALSLTYNTGLKENNILLNTSLNETGKIDRNKGQFRLGLSYSLD
jgi:hypothetical protein